MYKQEHPKFYPNWDFWFETIPSGNPVPDNVAEHLLLNH
jgi:hypothetical protein